MRFAIASLLILLPSLTFAEEPRIKIVKSSKLNIAITGLVGGRQASSPVTADRPPACRNSRDGCLPGQPGTAVFRSGHDLFWTP